MMSPPRSTTQNVNTTEVAEWQMKAQTARTRHTMTTSPSNVWEAVLEGSLLLILLAYQVGIKYVYYFCSFGRELGRRCIFYLQGLTGAVYQSFFHLCEKIHEADYPEGKSNYVHRQNDDRVSCKNLSDSVHFPPREGLVLIQ